MLTFNKICSRTLCLFHNQIKVWNGRLKFCWCPLMSKIVTNKQGTLHHVHFSQWRLNIMHKFVNYHEVVENFMLPRFLKEFNYSCYIKETSIWWYNSNKSWTLGKWPTNGGVKCLEKDETSIAIHVVKHIHHTLGFSTSLPLHFYFLLRSMFIPL